MSADEDNGLPPITLAAGGLVVGTLTLTLARRWSGCSRCAPRPAGHSCAGTTVAVVGALLLLGVVTAAVAYVTGIAAIRRLGSRLASFVALVEVLFGVLWAWLLLDELPRPVQLLGGVLILAGVVAVKLGERTTARPGPASR